VTDSEFTDAMEHFPIWIEGKDLQARVDLAAEMMAHLMRIWREQGYSRSLLGPTAGIYEGFWKLKLVPYGNFGARLHHWFLYAILRFLVWKVGDIPGVNDRLMTKWFILRDKEIADELFQRAVYHPNEMIRESCRWMLLSVAGRNPEFGRQLQDLDVTQQMDRWRVIVDNSKSGFCGTAIPDGTGVGYERS
jgi:hypothetical protein